MKHRWYDNDPTLSMAMSLLQNASKTHQEMTARHMFSVMKDQGLLDIAELRTKEDRLRFIFPTVRRSRFEMHARHLVELLKHLPPDSQQDMAVQLINHIYMLDCGLTEPLLPLLPEDAVSNQLPQPESC